MKCMKYSQIFRNALNTSMLCLGLEFHLEFLFGPIHLFRNTCNLEWIWPKSKPIKNEVHFYEFEIPIHMTSFQFLGSWSHPSLSSTHHVYFYQSPFLFYMFLNSFSLSSPNSLPTLQPQFYHSLNALLQLSFSLAATRIIDNPLIAALIKSFVSKLKRKF